MYITTIFILYMAAIFISLVFIVFIALIFVRKSERKNETYIAARRFAFIVMLTNLLYFIFYYREIVREVYELALPYRLADYVLCSTIFLAWILLMCQMINAKIKRVFIVTGIILTAIRLIVSSCITCIYMDAYYNITSKQILEYWSTVETGFIITTALLIIFSTIYALTEITSKFRQKYVAVCSGILLFWSSIQGVVDMGLYAGNYGISAWALEIPDFTGASMFILNLATCIFVYKEDFSPLFFEVQNSETGVLQKQEEGGLSMPEDEEDKFDAIASSHRLTVREREVLELMYLGFTNPEIAEKLFISINTVKKHTHNIFEKMDVGNRLEIVHMINAWGNKAKQNK